MTLSHPSHRLYTGKRTPLTKKEIRNRQITARRERYTLAERRKLWLRKRWFTIKDWAGALGVVAICLTVLVTVLAPTALCIAAIYWLLTH